MFDRSSFDLYSLSNATELRFQFISVLSLVTVCVCVCRYVVAYQRGDVRAEWTMRLRAETSRHVGQNAPALQSIQPVRQRHVRLQ